MVSLKARFFMEWNRLKNGRSEIGVLWNTASFILLLAIRFDIELTSSLAIVFGIVFLGISYIVGYYVTDNVLPETNRINPFSQDNINSAILLQQSLIYAYYYDKTKEDKYLDMAIEQMKKAQELRLKWLK
jgi:hypothetical protein